MSGSRRNSPFEYRDHWLGRVDGTPCWYVFWDEAPRQRRRATLGTDQLPAAKERLVSWVHERGHLEPDDPRRVTVAAVLDRYWHKHAKGRRSAEQARIAAAQILRFLGAATVAELTPQRQERLRAWLGEGRSPDTVSRVLSVLRAALRRAEKHQELTRVPFIFDVKRAAPRERFLSVEELARLHDGFDCDYGRMFFWLQLGTAGRKEAVLELTRFRCDTRRRLIRLNPEGRGQTAKRRATLPMVPHLVPLIEACRDGYLVHHNGAKLGDIKAAWRRARTKAGLGADVTTTALRRTVATWLRRRNVPEAECAAWMGHRWTNATTERYATWRPDHLATAARAVDELLRAVAAEIAARAQKRTAEAAEPRPGGP